VSPVEALAEFVLVLSPPVAPTGPGGPPARIGGEDDGESVYWLLSPSLILSTTRIKPSSMCVILSQQYALAQQQ